MSNALFYFLPANQSLTVMAGITQATVSIQVASVGGIRKISN
jgi:hypothetical protein